MADSSKVLPIALLAGGGYLLYQWFLKPATSTAQQTATPQTPTMPQAAPTGSSPAAGAASAPPTPASPAYNSLDSIFQRLQASIQQNAPNDPAIQSNQGVYVASPDVFNYYLQRAGGVDVTGAIGSGLYDSTGGGRAPISLPQFWSVAASWLAQNKGLSGLGLYGVLFSGGRRAS